MSLCEACADQGQCCRYVTLPIRHEVYDGGWLLSRPLSPDEQRWVNLHPGVTATSHYLSVQDGTPVRTIAGQPGTHTPLLGYSLRIDVPCSALSQEGRCSLFGTVQRPQMCSDWPDQPEQLDGLIGCAYQTIFQDQALSLSRS